MKAIRLLKSNRGISNYITSLIALCVILATVFVAMAAAKAMNQQQMLNEYAAQVIHTVCTNGSCDPVMLADEYELLTDTLGIEPTITFDTTYISQEKKNIQYGTQIQLTATLDIQLSAFGVEIPITLKAQKTGKSQIYWK